MVSGVQFKIKISLSSILNLDPKGEDLRPEVSYKPHLRSINRRRKQGNGRDLIYNIWVLVKVFKWVFGRKWKVVSLIVVVSPHVRSVGLQWKLKKERKEV